jgi:protein required for attachment to host cells
MQTLIAVVDATRARLFRYERTFDAVGSHENIVEEVDLVDPARRLRPSELFSDTPGTNRSGGRQYGVGDHRDEHMKAFDAKFAKTVAAEIARVRGANRLVLCASPNMMGALRAAGVNGDGELVRDLVKLTRSELRDELGKHGLLP